MGERLTDQQKAAVTDRGGNLLVSAAAGSGKTKVLVERLLRYLTDPDNPANLDEFLIITYTKAAAAELRGKIAARLTEAVAEDPDNRHLQQQMQRLYLTKISTVHSFCSDILREYAYRLDISGDFRVADETECLELQMRVIDELLDAAYASAEENPDFREFIDSQGYGRDDRQDPELILKVYNSAKCHLRPNDWLQWCVSAGNMEGIGDAAETVWGKYLVDELWDYLDLQTAALQNCIEDASKVADMEKTSVLLRDTLFQLQKLRKCTAWDDIQKGMNIDFGRLVLPRKAEDPILCSQIKAVRNACKKGLEKRARRFADPSEQIILDMESVSRSAKGLVDLVKSFSSAYEKLKRSHRILDFGDLEHRALDLLLGKDRSAPTAVAIEIGQRFREIMVDEYQDSNAVQDAIFTALTGKKHNCFMVGDVKQSIYQFRLADPDIFLDKYNRFRPADSAADGEDRKLLLSNNFRSAGPVISAVNDVFSVCMSSQVGGLFYGKDEALYEGIPHIPLNEPEVELYGITVREDTYREEASFVADRVCKLLDGTHMIREDKSLRPITPGDIVILLRSPGSIGLDYCMALEQRGIQCTMGGSGDLLESEEVSTLYALLQIINNPRQDIPLLAVMTSKLFCFTADDLASFRKNDRRSDIYTVLQNSCDQKIRGFLEVLNDLRIKSRMRKLTEIISYVFQVTRIDSIYTSLENGDERAENLRYFSQIAASYEANGISDLSRFLDQMATVAEHGLTVQVEERTENAVRIMSIHKSKGLEFPVVFLCGLAREFNRESLRASALCDKTLGIGLSCVNKASRVRYPSIAKTAIATKMSRESVSEEMRVLYVAMTRPKDRLIMTYAARNLPAELEDISLRMELSERRILTSEVDCPGKWILLTALQRAEAGAFFGLCNCYPKTKVSDIPWLIRTVEVTDQSQYVAQQYEQNVELPWNVVERMQKGIHFTYPNIQATQAPSKLTATQMKGRQKDLEAAEAAESKSISRIWRKPSFIEKQKDGKNYGNAIHAVMQYIRYEACDSETAVAQEIKRLVNAGYISEENGKLASCKKIATFFATDIGKQLLSGAEVLREFKFSLLDDGQQYYEGIPDEKVLLQGVVDCALLEPDGITVVDFKSDYVTDESLGNIVDKYRVQVTTYARALSRIYCTTVKKKLIYFFSLDRFVEVE